MNERLVISKLLKNVSRSEQVKIMSRRSIVDALIGVQPLLTPPGLVFYLRTYAPVQHNKKES